MTEPRELDIRGELTLDEAVVISICTGSLMCPPSDILKAVEERLDRKVSNAEFANNEFRHELQELYRPEFLRLCNKGRRIILPGEA